MIRPTCIFVFRRHSRHPEGQRQCSFDATVYRKCIQFADVWEPEVVLDGKLKREKSHRTYGPYNSVLG